MRGNNCKHLKHFKLIHSRASIWNRWLTALDDARSNFTIKQWARREKNELYPLCWWIAWARILMSLHVTQEGSSNGLLNHLFSDLPACGFIGSTHPRVQSLRTSLSWEGPWILISDALHCQRLICCWLLSPPTCYWGFVGPTRSKSINKFLMLYISFQTYKLSPVSKASI